MQLGQRLTGADEALQPAVELALDGTVLTANQQYLDVMGWSAAELVGQVSSLNWPSPRAPEGEVTLGSQRDSWKIWEAMTSWLMPATWAALATSSRYSSGIWAWPASPAAGSSRTP